MFFVQRGEFQRLFEWSNEYAFLVPHIISSFYIKTDYIEYRTICDINLNKIVLILYSIWYIRTFCIISIIAESDYELDGKICAINPNRIVRVCGRETEFWHQEDHWPPHIKMSPPMEFICIFTSLSSKINWGKDISV